MFAEVLDSCKKVENQLVSFAAVGVAMDEEAVQEATATCQAADQLIQVSICFLQHCETKPFVPCMSKSDRYVDAKPYVVRPEL